jgi:hypothetical protein
MSIVLSREGVEAGPKETFQIEVIFQLVCSIGIANILLDINLYCFCQSRQSENSELGINKIYIFRPKSTELLVDQKNKKRKKCTVPGIVVQLIIILKIVKILTINNKKTLHHTVAHVADAKIVDQKNSITKCSKSVRKVYMYVK